MKNLILTSFLLILIVFLSGCASQPEKQQTCNKPYVLINNDCCLDRNENSVCDINEKIVTENKTLDVEKPEEAEKITEKVNTKSEEEKLIGTILNRFELNDNQLTKDTILNIKFAEDNKWETGILFINGNKVDISQTGDTYSIYISKWVERGTNYYQIKGFNVSSSKIIEINVKNGQNYVSLERFP